MPPAEPPHAALDVPLLRQGREGLQLRGPDGEEAHAGLAAAEVQPRRRHVRLDLQEPGRRFSSIASLFGPFFGPLFSPLFIPFVEIAY